MNVEEKHIGAVTVLKPDGPLVQEDADGFGKSLTDAMRQSLGRLVVDLSSTGFVDSRGLEVLLEATDELSASGRTLKVCSLSETFREVLDITDLSGRFEFFEDATSAARSFL